MLGAVHLQIPDGLQVQILVIPVASGAESGECQQENQQGNQLFPEFFPLLRGESAGFFLLLFFIRFRVIHQRVHGDAGVLCFRVILFGKSKGIRGIGNLRQNHPAGRFMGNQIVRFGKNPGQLVGHLMGQQVITVGAVGQGFVLRKPDPGVLVRIFGGILGLFCLSGLWLFPFILRLTFLRRRFFSEGGRFLRILLRAFRRRGIIRFRGSGFRRLGRKNGRIFLRVNLQGRIRGNGGIVDSIALQISGQGMAHFLRIFPTGFRIGMNCPHNDLRQLVVGIQGRGKGLFRGAAVEGQLTIIIQLVQNHAHSIGIRREIEGIHGVPQFRRGVVAAIPVRNGSVFHGVQGNETQIADAVFFLVREVNIAGLQIHIQRPGLTAHGQRGAEIQSQVNGLQMGYGVTPYIFLQGTLIAAHQINLKAQTVLGDGFHLPAVVGQKTVQLGQGFQQFCLFEDSFSHFPEVIHGIRRIFISASQQKGVHLGLRGGDGDDFYDVLFIGIFLYRGTADNAVVAAHGTSHGEAVQQRRDESGFWQRDRLLYPVYHKI